MVLNARGFWRLLFVVYALCAALTVAVAIRQGGAEGDCRREFGASAGCLTFGEVLLLALLALAAEALILFGGALVVRWVYRGFLAAPGN